MTAKTVEDLELWKRATSFWKIANALLDRPAFDRDWKLRNQLRDATDSVLSNIAEGFEQATDRGFAKYLFDAKASAAEARKRLWMAAERRYISDGDYQEANAIGDEVARMTVGLIKYLLRSDRRDRGLGPSRDNGSSLKRQERLSRPQPPQETEPTTD
jgi:four helix bundle protein